MVLSKRERIIALMTLVIVGAFVLSKTVLGPVRGHLQMTEDKKQELLAQVVEAQNLFKRRQMLERKWKTMLSDGLRSDEEAESRVARALDEWSTNTGLTLSSVKPERAAGDKGLSEMTFTVAGKGRLDAVARFVYEVETAKMPIKVKDMQLGSSESADTMSLQLTLSALYLGAAPNSSRQQSQPKQQEANNEDQLLQ